MLVNIHFLNVGHGDCTIIEQASGNLTMIDINNGQGVDMDSLTELAVEQGISVDLSFLISPIPSLHKSGYYASLTDPVAFLQQIYPGRSIFRYIQTHPDLDHMRGLTALGEAGIDIVNFWDTCHNKNPDLRPEDEADWREYQAIRLGHRGATVLQLNRGAQNKFWNVDEFGYNGGDGIQILSPFSELTTWANARDNSNELSYVIWLTHAGRCVIFGGDAEEKSWEAIVDHYGTELKCDLLKASHHGRDSGYHQPAAMLMKPDLTVVPVGKKPNTDASNKYRQYSDKVFSTRWRGNIRVSIEDNGDMFYWTDRA